jgi:hypothetical protein
MCIAAMVNKKLTRPRRYPALHWPAADFIDGTQGLAPMMLDRASINESIKN